MKTIILISFFLLSGFNSVAAELTYVDSTATTWTSWGETYVRINGLDGSIYKRKKSKGPAWKNKALESLGNEYDFDHIGSNYTETPSAWEYLEKECGFSEDDIGDADSYDHKFHWGAVKKIKGSKKSVYYIVSWSALIEGGDKSCWVPQSGEYVFLNKIVKDQPVYLGRLED